MHIYTYIYIYGGLASRAVDFEDVTLISCAAASELPPPPPPPRITGGNFLPYATQHAALSRDTHERSTDTEILAIALPTSSQPASSWNTLTLLLGLGATCSDIHVRIISPLYRYIYGVLASRAVDFEDVTLISCAAASELPPPQLAGRAADQPADRHV